MQIVIRASNVNEHTQFHVHTHMESYHRCILNDPANQICLMRHLAFCLHVDVKPRNSWAPTDTHAHIFPLSVLSDMTDR